jgi:hypothetical protein
MRLLTRVSIARPVVPAREVVASPLDGAAALPLTRRLQRAKSRKGRFLLATFQEVVESIRPDAACLQVPHSSHEPPFPFLVGVLTSGSG